MNYNNNLQSTFKQQIPYGSTKTGEAWLMKSVHPSSVQEEYQGVPDGYPLPVVPVSYNQTITISPPASISASGTWEAEINLPFHPLFLATGTTILTDGTGATPYEVLNDQFAQTTLTNIRNAFLEMVERYRMSYGSVTCHFDAPALSDQGMVSCAQFPIGHRNMSMPPITGTIVGQFGSTARIIDQNDVTISFDDMQQMPNAYLGVAKEGIYVPYKTDGEARKWHNANDTVTYAASSLYTSYIDGTTVTSAKVFPFTNTGGAYLSGGTWNTGVPFPKACSEQMIRILFRNLSATAAITVYYRSGWEFQTRSATTLAPFQRIGPPLDQHALLMHDAILREMADGYPESYNSFEKLKAVVSKIASVVGKTVLPMGSLLMPTFKPAFDLLASGSNALARITQQKADTNRKKLILRPTVTKLKFARQPQSWSKLPTWKPAVVGQTKK